jgi:hypothetical protein
MWFAEFARDMDFPLQILPIDEVPYGLFFLCYLHSVTSNKNLSQVAINHISVFLHEPTKSINSDGFSLLERARNQLDYFNEGRLFDSLIGLLQIYDSSDDHVFFLANKMKGFISSSMDSSFEKSDLIDDWIEIVLFGNKLDFNIDGLKNELESLDPDDKKLVSSRLKTQWLKDKKADTNATCGFLDFLGITSDRKDQWHIDQCSTVLFNFANEFTYKGFKKEIDDSSEKLKDLEAFKEKMGDGLNSAIKTYPLFDDSIGVFESENLYYSSTIDNRFIEETANLYIKEYSSLFGNLIKQEMAKSSIPTIARENYRFSEGEVNQILAFKPDYMCNTDVIYDCSDLQKAAVLEIAKIDLPNMPRDLFWKGGAIGIKVRYDKTHSLIRSLTNDEIDKIIDNDYTMINGLYKYGDGGNAGISALVTRE